MLDIREKVTLMVIGQDDTKTYQINRIIVKYLRPALFFVALVLIVLLILLLGISGKYFYDRMQFNQATAKLEELQQSLADVKQAKSAEIQLKLEQLSDTEKTIAQLQNYLIARGVKDIPQLAQNDVDQQANQIVANVGGPEYETNLTDSYNEVYNAQLKNLLDVVRQVPLGYSHKGIVTSTFGNRHNPFGKSTGEFHSGMDFRGVIGDTVKATADGVVTVAGVMGGYGNVIKIKHGFGYSTVYAHLSKIKVKVGQQVNAGDCIGLVGNTGRSTGPHLHYEVRLNDVSTNPAKFLTVN